MADLGMSEAQIARYCRFWWREKPSAIVRADAQTIILNFPLRNCFCPWRSCNKSALRASVCARSRDVAVAPRPHVVMRGAGFGQLAAAMALAKWA